MRYLLCLAILTGVTAVAQQGSHPTPPPQSTPPIIQDGITYHPPPQAKAPAAQAMSTPQVQQHIRDKIDADPALRNTNVSVNANKEAVILAGLVDTEKQHQIAVKIAQSYAGGRQILDRIEVKKKS